MFFFYKAVYVYIVWAKSFVVELRLIGTPIFGLGLIKAKKEILYGETFFQGKKASFCNLKLLTFENISASLF